MVPFDVFLPKITNSNTFLKNFHVSLCQNLSSTDITHITPFPREINWLKVDKEAIFFLNKIFCS